jgi:hypothetical protein
VPVSPAAVDFESSIIALNGQGGKVGITQTMVVYVRDRFG